MDENTLDYGHQFTAEESAQIATLHRIFDDAMIAAIDSIKKMYPKKESMPKPIIEQYKALFSLNKPTEYVPAFYRLQRDILFGSSSIEKRPFTTAELSEATIILQQMAEQAFEHLAHLKDLEQEKLQYTKGVLGKIKGLFNPIAREKAVRAAKVGSVGIAMWQQVCELLQEEISKPLNERLNTLPNKSKRGT